MEASESLSYQVTVSHSSGSIQPCPRSNQTAAFINPWGVGYVFSAAIRRETTSDGHGGCLLLDPSSFFSTPPRPASSSHAPLFFFVNGESLRAGGAGPLSPRISFGLRRLHGPHGRPQEEGTLLSRSQKEFIFSLALPKIRVLFGDWAYCSSVVLHFRCRAIRRDWGMAPRLWSLHLWSSAASKIIVTDDL